MNLANELRVQEGVLPSALAPVLPVLFIPNGRLLGALQSLVNGVYKGPFAKLQTFFAVSHDSASGRFVLDDDRLSLAWPNAKDEPVYARLDAMLSAIVKQSGGSYVKNPLAGTVMGHQPATAHPLGGAGMGRERDDGVVNHKGQVFDAGAGARADCRARGAVRRRRRGDPALDRRQSAADDHRAGRAHAAAHAAGLRALLRRRAAHRRARDAAGPQPLPGRMSRTSSRPGSCDIA